MDDRNEREFDVEVKPGFIVTMIGLVLVYALFNVVATVRLGAPVSFLQSLNWGASVTVLVLLGTMFHELGHVLAGVAAGHQWTKAVLNGAGMGVVIEPKPRGWDRVLRSMAGPLAHFVFALPLLAVAVSSLPAGLTNLAIAQTSIWWVAGASSLFLAVFNLLPVPGFDGGKAMDGMRDVLGHRRAVVSGGRFVKT